MDYNHVMVTHLCCLSVNPYAAFASANAAMPPYKKPEVSVIDLSKGKSMA